MLNVYSSLASPSAPASALGETPGKLALSQGLVTALSLARVAGAAGGAYHGYKRNNGSIGWAIGWAVLGGAFWPVTIPVALAQGFGKPKSAEE